MKRTLLKRKTRLKAVNRKRAALRKKRDFGPYADWIQGLWCIAPYGGEGFMAWWPCPRIPVEAAHVRSRGAGGHSEGNLVPLCRAHHQQQHQIGRKTFEEVYKIDLRAVATALAARYAEEAEK